MVLNALWVSIVFGILSTRFRDIAPMLGSLTMVLFLLSPVVWDGNPAPSRIAPAVGEAGGVESRPTTTWR